MTRNEKRQLAFTQFNPNSEWVMDCTFPKLAETCLSFLTLIDDAQQKAFDEVDLEKAQDLSCYYNAIEKIYQRIKLRGVINNDHREQLRGIIKYAFKLATA